MSTLGLAAVSFTFDGASAASGIGVTNIKAAVKRGDLVAHYVGVKAVIRAVDLDEWVASLPSEDPKRQSKS